MPFNFPCPKCGKTILNVPESYSGQRGRCLNCKGLVTIPTMVVEEIRASVAPQEQLVSKPVVKTGGGNTAVREVASSRVKPSSPPALDQALLDLPEMLPPLVTPPGGVRSRRSQKSRGGSVRRYPILRRYCGMLTVVSLIIGISLVILGIGVAFSVVFGASIPALGSASGLLIVLVGLGLGIGGYGSLVVGLTMVEVAKVLMDIEENVRKGGERAEGAESGAGESAT